jgi:hypothetical protein
MEHLDGARGDAHIDFGANERVRHRVEKVRNLDMVVETDAGEAPFRVFIMLRRQSPQRRPLDALEQIPPARSQMPRHALVERRYAVTDRVVQIGQREELAVPQLGDDPACRQQNGHLDLGLGERQRLQVMRVRPAKRCASRIPSIPFAVARSS